MRATSITTAAGGPDAHPAVVADAACLTTTSGETHQSPQASTDRANKAE
ncbi:MAG: hypothetical protein ABIQ18_41830 [Umezawaea sp.]